MGEGRKVASVAIEQDEEQGGGHPGRTKVKESPLCYIDGHLSSQNAELEPKYQEYKGRVVLRGDVVKDDAGEYAVFTEQGSSASRVNRLDSMVHSLANWNLLHRFHRLHPDTEQDQRKSQPESLDSAHMALVDPFGNWLPFALAPLQPLLLLVLHMQGSGWNFKSSFELLLKGLDLMPRQQTLDCDAQLLCLASPAGKILISSSKSASTLEICSIFCSHFLGFPPWFFDDLPSTWPLPFDTASFQISSASSNAPAWDHFAFARYPATLAAAILLEELLACPVEYLDIH